MSGWRIGQESGPKAVEDYYRGSHPQKGTAMAQAATVTIITDRVKRVVPGAAPQPTPGIRISVDGPNTTVGDLLTRYEKRYRAGSGCPDATVAHLETLSGRILDHRDPRLTVDAAGVDGQALRAVFPREVEAAANAPPPAARRVVEDLGVLEDEPDRYSAPAAAPAGVVVDDAHLSPLERAKARRARAKASLDGTLAANAGKAKAKPPPQPMPTLPPNAFPPQPVVQAGPATGPSSFHKKYDKWNNFGGDDDSD